MRLKTSLPADPNIYGFGEHSDPFRVPTGEDYQRTLWNADGAFLPPRSNIYGSHPMYIEHRKTGTHGVLLLNSNGMDIKIKGTGAEGAASLEYNTIGGVLDFYFFAGSSPTEVSEQHASAMGLPAMVPYWSLGYHQAKYGYWDVNMLAEVVGNYTKAGIPLEVIWGDIDYMDGRKDFTFDEERFPLEKMRELVDTLHDRKMKWVMMLDPGISTEEGYEAVQRGREAGAFLKADDGSDYRGVQWPGEVVWPDYFSDEGKKWWTSEIQKFFDPETGVDIDGAWNDMNEVHNFCGDISCDPAKQAEDDNIPPEPENPPRNNTGRPIPGFPDSFQPDGTLEKRRAPGDKLGLPGRDLFEPLYKINTSTDHLSDQTLYTNITNHDGTHQYDTHNMYGLSMVKATYQALLARRPGVRPFVLTRSTFLTAAKWSAHWFGDNESIWQHYRISIAQMLGFTAVHNTPMVGTDVCGFNGEAQENMCARWAMLAAFMPFMRNHADISAPHQEFYLWDSVAAAARKAIDARYRLLDYLYTAVHRSHRTGAPSVRPLFYAWPGDEATYGVDLQFLLGDAVLVSPVTDDDARSVTFYLPDDVFYDFWTREPVRGGGEAVTRDDVAWDDIPVHIRGGSVIPMRVDSANTTAELRQLGFELLVAPGGDGTAKGSLVLDDGESIDGSLSDVAFAWDGSKLVVDGDFGYESGLAVERVVVLGEKERSAEGDWSLDSSFEVNIS